MEVGEWRLRFVVLCLLFRTCLGIHSVVTPSSVHLLDGSRFRPCDMPDVLRSQMGVTLTLLRNCRLPAVPGTAGKSSQPDRGLPD